MLNGLLSLTTGFNVLSNTLNFVTNKMNPNKQEIKSVGLTGAGYNDNTGGSYDIKKSAEWTGTDTAQVKFNIDTRMKTSDSHKDVVLVLDISGSMSGEKLNKVKSDAKELTSSLLSDKENRVALITFESTSKIEYELTNNKEELLAKIDSLTDTGCTNYNQALINVDKILDGYEKKDNRDLVVLFLTDGYPNEETPNQVSQYKMLKEKYPYMTINGIQYEMGKDIINDIKNISDNQYIASMDTLNNVLFEASVAPKFYEKFELIDYIHNDYFYVESVNDIKVSMGKVELTEENGVQKIIWTANPDEFRTGSKANMTINLKLKEQYVGTEGYYPTNKGVEVTTKLPEEKEKETTTKETPILKAGYKVIYDTNTPTGCELDNFEETHYAFENVMISAKKLDCNGYIFKGWEIIDKVTNVNEDYFIMPSRDVSIKATWTKQEITKSMNGTIYEAPTLYTEISKQSVLDNMASTYVSSPTGIDFSKISSDTNGKGVYTLSSTIGEKYPIYYYRGAVDNNNVIFGNFCWKIVRTTDTGGVKLIYNGVPNNGVCNNTGEDSQIGNSSFNSSYNSPAYNGYMYGTVYSYNFKKMSSEGTYLYGNSFTYDGTNYHLTDTKEISNWQTGYNTINNNHYTCFNTSGTCTTLSYIYYTNSGYAYYINLTGGKSVEDALKEMRTNTKNSTIKTTIDNWYKTNLTNYTENLEDTVWCNDRSSTEENGWSEDGDTTKYLYYSPRTRTYSTYQPSLMCQNKNDAFTVSEEKGNGSLTYPVGLLTSDEVMYAGGKGGNSNSSYYLNTGKPYWTLSPSNFFYNNAFGFSVNSNGDLAINNVGNSYGVRPVVSLQPDTRYTNGDGTMNNPYVVVE